MNYLKYVIIIQVTSKNSCRLFYLVNMNSMIVEWSIQILRMRIVDYWCSYLTLFSFHGSNITWWKIIAHGPPRLTNLAVGFAEIFMCLYTFQASFNAKCALGNSSSSNTVRYIIMKILNLYSFSRFCVLPARNLKIGKSMPSLPKVFHWKFITKLEEVMNKYGHWMFTNG